MRSKQEFDFENSCGFACETDFILLIFSVVIFKNDVYRQPETVFVPQMFVPETGQSWHSLGSLLFQASRDCAHAHMIFTAVLKRDAVS